MELVKETRLCQVTACGQPMPTGDNSTACPDCWASFDRTVGDIPALVVELETTLSRQTSSGQANGPRSTETPLPYSTAASDALRLLQTTLWPWAREGLDAHPTLKARSRFARETNTLVGTAITDMAALLLHLRGWLATHPDGYQAIDEVAYACAQGRQAIDRAPDRTYAGTCDTDGCAEELYAVDGRATVVCQVCSTERDVAAWRYARLADAADQLLTLSEMTRAVAETGDETVSRKRLEGWVRRGRLLRSGNVGATATYRVGDVLDILDDERRRCVS